MTNLVEFDMTGELANDKVYIAPAHVVKVERYASTQGYDSMIDLVQGSSVVVKGPPSEVIARLRKGA